MEPRIIAKNQPAMTVSTVIVQTPQTIKAPTMQEFIAVMTPYNTGANRTPQRASRIVIDGSTIATSGIGTSAVASCPSSTPPFVFN